MNALLSIVDEETVEPASLYEYQNTSSCFVSFSERLACSKGMRQSIQRESSKIEIPQSVSALKRGFINIKKRATKFHLQKEA